MSAIVKKNSHLSPVYKVFVYACTIYRAKHKSAHAPNKHKLVERMLFISGGKCI